jgi:hypothetical protein
MGNHIAVGVSYRPKEVIEVVAIHSKDVEIRVAGKERTYLVDKERFKKDYELA